MASKKELLKRIEQLESELKACIESEHQAQRLITALKKERDEHLQFMEENKTNQHCNIGKGKGNLSIGIICP